MYKSFDTIDAHHIGCVTLVGVSSTDYPLGLGNCFDLITQSEIPQTLPEKIKVMESNSYRIVNFVYENFIELFERGTLNWPVKIHPISKSLAILHDERIPHSWYPKEFCQVCCGYEHLPITQKLAKDRDIKSGHLQSRHPSE